MRTTSAPLDGAMARGIAWIGGMKWITQGISWAITLVVAHLLTPMDYGIMGMAAVYLGLAQLLGDAGLTAVIIQTPVLTRETAARLGGLGVMAGVALAAISVGAAGGVAWFFEEPAVYGVVTVMSVSFLVRGLQVLPRGLLMRELKFRDVAWIDAAESLAVALTTLVGASLGLRYWALVTGAVAGSVASTAVALARAPHAVRFPRRWQELSGSIALGGQVLSSQLAWYTYSNADFAVVGRLLGKAVLGAYTFAWTMASMPIDRLTSLVGRVAPPVFAAVQGDPPELRRHLRNLTEGVALVTLPLCVGLALVAPEFVSVALGDAWRAAVMPLRLLALYAAFRCIVALLPTVLVYTGHAKRNMQFSFAAVAVLPAAFVVGTRWGTTGVAIVWITVYPAFIAATYIWYSLRAVGMTWTEYAAAIWPAASGTAVMTAGVLAARALMPSAWPDAARLAAMVSVGAVVYLSLVGVLHGRRVLDAVRLVTRGSGPAELPAPIHGSAAGEARPRLLVVSYHFPPSAAVGGLRWQKLVRAAHERGWGVDVITAVPPPHTPLDANRLADLPRGTEVYAIDGPRSRLDATVDALWRRWRGRARLTAGPPSAGARAARPASRARDDAMRVSVWRDVPRAFFAWRAIRAERRWGRRTARLAARLVEARGHRAVISSGPPHFVHEPLLRVARARQVPFVADLRDPWALVQRLPESIASPWWLLSAAAGERRVVRQASLIVLNTEPLRLAMERRHPRHAGRFVTVSNGCDDEPVALPAPVAPAERRFTIAYAGTIYLDRDPRPLFHAVARVARSRGLDPARFRLEFMGHVADFDGVPLAHIAAECGVEGYVRLHGPQPRTEALAFLAAASMLVVLPQDSDLAIPAKVFEYARFPAWVLALADAGSATAALLHGTDADVISPARPELIASAIERRVVQFERGERAAPLARFGHLSRRAQARVLFEALEAVTGSPREAEPAPRFEEEGTGVVPPLDFPAVAAGAVAEH